MDPGLAAALAALAGALAGALAVLVVVRAGGRSRGTPAVPSLAAPPAPVVPEGIDDVLAALRPSALLLDAAGRVLKASPTAYALGLVRGDGLVTDELRSIADAVRSDGEIRESEVTTQRALGAERVSLSARVAPLGGELVLVLVEDRTEAQRLDAVRRDFVANVSHELKTPVGALRLLGEAILGASDDPDAVRRFAGRMQHEAVRLSTLVQELIDLSRLQDRDALAEPAVVDLDDVVVEAIDRCSLNAQRKGIRIASGGTDGVRVLGDEEMLVTALRNLVDNAVNYSPAGTRVAVGVRQKGAVVEVSVTDQGYGIPEADLERIFERFYRVDPARSRETGGTGLGLSIVKHVVANHGGEMTVWSVDGAGSTFTMRLPVATAADAPHLPAEPSSHEPSPRGHSFHSHAPDEHARDEHAPDEHAPTGEATA